MIFRSGFWYNKSGYLHSIESAFRGSRARHPAFFFPTPAPPAGASPSPTLCAKEITASLGVLMPSRYGGGPTRPRCHQARSPATHTHSARAGRRRRDPATLSCKVGEHSPGFCWLSRSRRRARPRGIPPAGGHKQLPPRHLGSAPGAVFREHRPHHSRPPCTVRPPSSMAEGKPSHIS